MQGKSVFAITAIVGSCADGLVGASKAPNGEAPKTSVAAVPSSLTTTRHPLARPPIYGPRARVSSTQVGWSRRGSRTAAGRSLSNKELQSAAEPKVWSVYLDPSKRMVSPEQRSQTLLAKTASLDKLREDSGAAMKLCNQALSDSPFEGCQLSDNDKAVALELKKLLATPSAQIYGFLSVLCPSLSDSDRAAFIAVYCAFLLRFETMLTSRLAQRERVAGCVEELLKIAKMARDPRSADYQQLMEQYIQLQIEELFRPSKSDGTEHDSTQSYSVTNTLLLSKSFFKLVTDAPAKSQR